MVLLLPLEEFTSAPDCYMDKIAGGPEALAGEISLEGSVAYNIEQAANALDKDVREVKIVAPDRERHAGLSLKLEVV